MNRLSLRQFFLLLFGFCVLIALFSFALLSRSAFERAQELAVRQAKSEHLKLGIEFQMAYQQRIDFLFDQIRIYLKKVQDASNKKARKGHLFAAAWDPRLQCYLREGERFFNRFSRLPESWRIAYRSEYNWLKKMYTSEFLPKISVEADKSPVLIQLYGLHKSVNGKVCTTYGDFFQGDLRPKNMADTDRETYLRNLNLYDSHFYGRPFYPLIYFEGQDQFFSDELMVIAREIIRAFALGKDLMASEVHKSFDLLKLNLLGSRNQILQASFFGLEADLLWEFLPLDYDYDTYRQGKSPVFDAFFLSIVKRSEVQSQFLQGLNQGKSIPGLENFQKTLKLKGIQCQIIDAGKLNLLPSQMILSRLGPKYLEGSDYKEHLKRVKENQEGLHIEIKTAKGEPMQVTFMPVEGMKNLILFFCRPIKPVLQKAETMSFVAYLLFGAFVLLALFSLMYLLKTMLGSLLHVQKSMEFSGLQESRAYLQGRESNTREVESLKQGFLEMSSQIEIHLLQMETIQAIHTRLNQGEERNQVLELVLKTLCQIFQVSGGLAAFKHGGTTDILAFGTAKVEQFEQDDQRARFRADLGEGLVFLVELDCKKEQVDWPMVKTLMDQSATIFAKTTLDAIARDTALGRELQTSLLPPSSPIAHEVFDLASLNFASRGLAGDYFDFWYTDTELILSIADVSGKGIGPSLFGASSRSLMRLIIQNEDTDILESINRHLCRYAHLSLFETLFLARIDLQTKTMRYASAGHNGMLLKQGSEILELKAKGLPLGMFDKAVYEWKTLNLACGDSLLLYTDGVTEMEDQSQNLFGLKALKEEFLSSNAAPFDFLARLQETLARFRGSTGLSDDVTLLSLRIK